MRYFWFIALLTMLAITATALRSKTSRGITGAHFRQTLNLVASSRSLSASPTAIPSVDFRLSETRKIGFSAKTDYDGFDGDVLIVPMYQSRDATGSSANLSPTLKLLNGAVFSHSVVNDLINDRSFKAESGSEHIVRIYNHSTLRVKYVALVGLGPVPKKEDSISSSIAKRMASAITSVSEKIQAKHIGIILPAGTNNEHISNMMVGIHHALYKDDRFRLPPKDKSGNSEVKQAGGPLEHVSFLAASSDITEKLPATQQSTEKIVSGINFAKDLVGAPANSKTPVAIANAAKELAKAYGLECTVLGLEECQRLNMGGYLGVQQGSKFPPQFVHMVYRPSAPAPTGVTKVALIGKGLTFDSGGYNLKSGPGSMIELMKFDMGGCGAVLGTAKAIAQLQPNNVEVHFISAICENMISAEAMRPGDILVASNGKTIEVLNTDAEGRLTLADALVYAQQLQVDQIIDLATLTGACIMALGDKVAGLYANNASLRQQLEASATRSGDKLWYLPLESSYKESIKSTIADLKNISGGKGGGSITAALFLQEFLEKNAKTNRVVPWAHIDMAGPVWNNAKSAPTGYGVRLLVDYLLHIQQQSPSSTAIAGGAQDLEEE